MKINPLSLKPHGGGWKVDFEVRQNYISISDLLHIGPEFLSSSLTSLSFCLFINWEDYPTKMCYYLTNVYFPP